MRMYRMQVGTKATTNLSLISGNDAILLALINIVVKSL